MVDPAGSHGTKAARSGRVIWGACVLALVILLFLPFGYFISPLLAIAMAIGVVLQKRGGSTSSRERRRLLWIAATLAALWFGIIAFWISASPAGSDPKAEIQYKELPTQHP